jgi:hypothetical protein
MTTAQARAAPPADGVQLINKNDIGAALRASSNSPGTRDAPTPTNISIKSEPVML